MNFLDMKFNVVENISSPFLLFKGNGSFIIVLIFFVVKAWDRFVILKLYC